MRARPDGGGRVAPATGAASEAMLFDLHFPARADRLKLARAGVMAAARMCGFAEPAARDIVLAVDEACQNVIRHAYGDEAAGDMALTLVRRGGSLVVRLRDFAPTVDRTTIAPRPLGRIVPGGLGTHFIRAIMDRVAYLEPPDGCGNLLEMAKVIPKQENASDELTG